MGWPGPRRLLVCVRLDESGRSGLSTVRTMADVETGGNVSAMIRRLIDEAIVHRRDHGRGLDALVDALRLIDRHGCEHFTSGYRCLDPDSGKVRGAEFGADVWCDPCVAAGALRTIDNQTDTLEKS